MARLVRRVLMLDVDGVLVTHHGVAAGSWSDWLERDLGLGVATLREAFFRAFWPDIVTGKAPMMPSLRAALAQIGTDVTAEQLRDYWFEKDSLVVPEVLADVQRLRAEGWRVWLCTNQEHERADYLMETVGLSAHVDGMLYSAKLGAKKPDLEFYRRIEAEVGASVSLFADDRLPNVEAARVAGWRAHHWVAGDGLYEIAVGNSGAD